MLPRDTAKIVYAIVLALPSTGNEANGTTADLADLVRKVNLIRNYYQNTITTVNEKEQNHLNNLSISINSIYPNPANDLCKIDFYLPKSENVVIEITNLYGKLLSSIPCDLVTNGLNTIEINMKNLSSGAYFVTLRTATEHISKLINIIK